MAGEGGLGEVVMTTALLYNPQGEVLLQHRDDKPDIAHPNLWSLFGGHKEAGEELSAALVRELEEEIGFVPTTFHLWTVAREPGVVFYIYLVPIDEPLGALELNEGQDFGFFDPSAALRTLALTPVGRFVLEAFRATKRIRKSARRDERRHLPSLLYSQRSTPSSSSTSSAP